MKQEAGIAQEEASSTATSYVDKAKATGSDAVASAQVRRIVSWSH